ncbi:MAG: amidohydrolase family protein [Parvularculaceae bacterium]|nr:amidohydrolase family protein [Parvularculaceae bacterium]
MTATVIKNVKIFDGSGEAPFPGSVRIEANRIVAVDRGEKSPASGDARVIDGEGGTLMPGMVDAHAHLALGTSVETLTKKPGNHPAETLALIEAHCGRVMLDHGFTSAYSGGSGSVEAEVAVKEAFDAGWLPGPRLVTSSFERMPGGPVGLVFKFPGYETRKSHPEGIGAFVEEMADKGAQAVKFLLNGVSAFDPGKNTTEQFYDEEVMAAGEAARRKGVWLTAHCYTPHSIKLAIAAGFRTLYHCNYADEEALDAIEAAKDSIFVGLAPGIEESHVLRAKKFGVMASPEQVEEQDSAIEHIKVTGNELRKRGVRSVIGGDYGFPWNPVGLNARDLELFVDWFGYTPTEALVAATKLGGQIMDMEDELGLIKPGYLADVLVVRGDPAEDIALMTKKENLAVIMKDGRLHKGERLTH